MAIALSRWGQKGAEYSTGPHAGLGAKARQFLQSATRKRMLLSMPAPISPRYWPAWLGIGLLVMLARLPYGAQRVLGRALGPVLRVLMRSRAQVARRNLQLCFPQLDADAREKLLRENFRSLGMAVLEFPMAWWGALERVPRLCEVDGLEHLAVARDRGQGVLLVGAHFHHLEIAGRALCAKAPVAGMYRPHGNAAMEWAVRRGRLRYAAAMFRREDLRGIVRHLKQGGILWYAPDHDYGRAGSVFAPFFGVSALSITATHQLARMTGACVIPLYQQRLPQGGYRIHLGPAMTDFPSEDAAADTARVNAMIEDMIRAAPAEYLWIHKRFKHRPEGEPDRYR